MRPGAAANDANALVAAGSSASAALAMSALPAEETPCELRAGERAGGRKSHGNQGLGRVGEGVGIDPNLPPADWKSAALFPELLARDRVTRVSPLESLSSRARDTLRLGVWRRQASKFRLGISRGRFTQITGRSSASLSTRLCSETPREHETATPHTAGPSRVRRLETSVASTEAAREGQNQQSESRAYVSTRFQQVVTGRICLRSTPPTAHPSRVRQLMTSRLSPQPALVAAASHWAWRATAARST